VSFELKKELGYFSCYGVDAMAFDDIYPEGHQSGVSLILHGNRVATNGDVRFEPTPGQWQPVPKQGKRELDFEKNTIVTQLSYPDKERHLKGFNPMVYPDYEFEYQVTVKGEGQSIVVTVDLNEPIPEKFLGHICFNLELFPGELMGKPWIMDDKQGIFPHQPNGPTLAKPSNYPAGTEYNPIIADDIISLPYAVGSSLTIRPDDELNCFTIEGDGLKLYDGRMNHNNGWFVVSSEIPAGVTKNAIKWIITPRVNKDWLYTPVVQTSQVGYHPMQKKVAFIELDKRDNAHKNAILCKVNANGTSETLLIAGAEWGNFLRYQYLKFDFSDVKEEGLYKISYGESESSIFRISNDVYDRGIWQPVLEYFLPVQMCHMRVNEKYRVWHDLCHTDDAKMAPINLNHFDGYVQGASTLTKFKPGEDVPGLNAGGWHDAGDFDIRIESQSAEIYALSLAYEEFGVYYDISTIDQTTKTVEIHQPDGKNDILQQIEHGLLSIIGGYNALGRFYRGIICNTLRQYVLLGDGTAMTDTRWVFTEDNPTRELMAASHVAAAARAIKGFNDELSANALKAACEIFEATKIPSKSNTSDTAGGSEDASGALSSDASEAAKIAKIHAAVELLLTTGEAKYRDHIISETKFIAAKQETLGWIIARVEKTINDDNFSKAVRNALPALKEIIDGECNETPYGVPYRPQIWGAGWGVQRMGFQYFFLHKAYPEIFDSQMIFSALNFVLGTHPGSNTVSFASGVGTKSAMVGYGLNRADWSYIPGGVISGTALIRPDFPELLTFPYLWQQVEYVIGGGSSHYMFLVLAAMNILKDIKK